MREHYRGGYNVAGMVSLARELRQRQTAAEAYLWALLRNRQFLGAKFRRQHQYGSYILDFFCADAQLVVECDGAIHDRSDQRKLDQMRDAYLSAKGLTVLRFSNEAVLNRTEEVLKAIGEVLASALTPNPSPSDTD